MGIHVEGSSWLLQKLAGADASTAAKAIRLQLSGLILVWSVRVRAIHEAESDGSRGMHSSTAQQDTCISSIAYTLAIRNRILEQWTSIPRERSQQMFICLIPDLRAIISTNPLPSTAWIFLNSKSTTSNHSLLLIIFDHLDHPPCATSQIPSRSAETACTSLSLCSRNLPQTYEAIKLSLFTPRTYPRPISSGSANLSRRSYYWTSCRTKIPSYKGPETQRPGSIGYFLRTAAEGFS